MRSPIWNINGPIDDEFVMEGWGLKLSDGFMIIGVEMNGNWMRNGEMGEVSEIWKCGFYMFQVDRPCPRSTGDTTNCKNLRLCLPSIYYRKSVDG